MQQQYRARADELTWLRDFPLAHLPATPPGIEGFMRRQADETDRDSDSQSNDAASTTGAGLTVSHPIILSSAPASSPFVSISSEESHPTSSTIRGADILLSFARQPTPGDDS